MQLGHGGAQQPGGLGQGVVDAFELGRPIGIAHVVEVLPGGEHVLQRAIVQGLGEIALLALLEGQQFSDQLTAITDQAADGHDS